MLWRRAAPADQTALQAFIEPRETYATGFSWRARGEDGRLTSMERGRGGLFLYDEPGRPGSLEMAVLLSSSGTAFPVLGGSFDDGGPSSLVALQRLSASRTVRAWRPSACVGASDHVNALISALHWKQALAVEYDAMNLPPGTYGQHGRSSLPGSRAAVSGIAEYRRATMADLDSLYPLAAAYEKSEVMTVMHTFDPAVCRATQAKNLKTQLVYLATMHGRVVARAQTNARGWIFDQIGGIFVDPEFRGLGLGRGVVDALVSNLADRGRGVSLFVKKSNDVARSLYLNLGFQRNRDYRVSYFA
jgi:GNAT superfamily N-acetyltransferase